MTATQQPEALQLADDAWNFDGEPYGTAKKANAAMMGLLQDCSTEIRRLHARVVELESQLEAIGAGGVESLRGDKPLTDNQIQAIDDSTHFHESPDWNLRFARAIEKHHGIGA